MIALLAILMALIAIISKVVNHIQYVINSTESPKISDFLFTLFPLFLRDKNKEASNNQLKRRGTSIIIYLLVFYASLILFFAITAF